MFTGIRPRKWRKLVYKIKPEFNRLGEDNRLYKLKVPVIGLTGGVATGKSTVTKKLKGLGIPVIEADKLVHDIYAKDQSISFIKENFPTAITGNKIDFKALRKIFFENTKAQEKIENFIYAQLEKEFLKEADNFSDHDFIIYDVPLLFEKKLHKLVDLSITVYAGKETQIARMIERDGIDKELAIKMLQKQIDIENKRELSEWVIENQGTLSDLDLELAKFLKSHFTK